MPNPTPSPSSSEASHASHTISPSPILPPSQTPGRPASKLRIFLILVIVSGLGYLGLRMVQNHPPAAAPPRGGAGTGMPVPVLAGTVGKKDIPIYLDGIGNVQAFNTVTASPRVDGEVKQVAFREGQDVQAGDLLAVIDPAPFQAAYDQAVAKKAQDEAQRANAQINLKREEDLFAKKAVSAQERDAQQALANQLDATVKADAAAIQSAKVELDYTRIVAPIAGRTGLRRVDQGNVVRASDPAGIVVVTQLQPIAMVFTLPEQNLAEIKRVGGSDFKVLAVDRDTSTVLDTGALSVIDNQIDPTTGTIRLKATFANENLQLWPGQFVNARLLLTVRQGGLAVPAQVVQRGPQGAFAFVIKSDETVEIRPVKVGPIEEGQALIEEGLQAGERVVVDGQYKLQPGSKVKMNEGTRREGGTRARVAPNH